MFSVRVASLILSLASLGQVSGLTCEVAGGSTDDAPSIISALNECSNGGTVVLDKTYTIGSVMATTNLSDIAIEWTGTVNLSTNMSYWKSNSIQLTFQDAYTAWTLGGKNIHIYGGGVFNGGGDTWYAAGETGPVMWTVYDATNVLIEDITMKKSPFWHNFVVGSTNVTYNNIVMNSVQDDGTQAQNTDGWDTYRSSYVTIQNCNIRNGDDCVSFKPNSTFITVENLYCNGSHGISVGSLGQYAGEVDIVSDVYVKNITMANAENGARIKAFGGSASSTSTKGGGSGYVKNVTFEDFKCVEVELPIVINQCYETSTSTCESYPSKVLINDIHYINVTGTGSKSYEVVTLVCSDECDDITATGTNLVGTKGGSEYICQNVNSTAELDFPCDASGVTVIGTTTETGSTTKTSKTSTKTTAAATTTADTVAETTASSSTKTSKTKTSKTKSSKTSTAESNTTTAASTTTAAAKL